MKTVLFLLLTLSLKASPERWNELANLDEQPEVVGVTGIPLGQIFWMIVEPVHGSETGLKRYQGEVLLRVHSVDGKDLDSPPLLEFRSLGIMYLSPNIIDYDRQGMSLDEVLGMRITLLCFESGGFRGVPMDASELIFWQSEGFHFVPRLEIVADLSRYREYEDQMEREGLPAIYPVPQGYVNQSTQTTQ